MHTGRLFGGEEALAPVFQLRCRPPAVMRSRIERPAEMLSGVTQPNAQAVMAAYFFIERADVRELLGKRRHLFEDAGLEPAADLAGQPGLTLRAAADHDGIGAGFIQR